MSVLVYSPKVCATGIIDEEKKVKHSKLSEEIEQVLADPQKIQVKLTAANLDIAYAPIVQSGGQYDLKVSAASDDRRLEYDVILCSLGARYSMYCANIARTYLVDPVKQQEEEYKALLQAQDKAIAALVEGASMSAAMAAVVKALQVLVVRCDVKQVVFLPVLLMIFCTVHVRHPSRSCADTSANSTPTVFLCQCMARSAFSSCNARSYNTSISLVFQAM